jgi:hypothetical protein
MPEHKKLTGTVLVCPLNWGMGHAARCIPVIWMFQRKGLNVIVAGDEPVLAYLKDEFGATVKYLHLAGFRVRYPSRGSFALKILTQLPGFIYNIWKEHILLNRLIKETGARLLVSDNRYGLFTNKAKTIFLTHQIYVKAPRCLRWTKPVLDHCNHWMIKRFDTCWVPDTDDSENLSGDLSQSIKLSGVKYIGVLSRFYSIDAAEEQNPLTAGFPDDFILVLLSGPEPQRSILEKKLMQQLRTSGDAVVFVRGLIRNSSGDDSNLIAHDDHIAHDYHCKNNESFDERVHQIDFSNLPSKKLAYLIRKSRLVICRSGYSTIMDLAVFGKKALLIPTPGQTEQEYLAKRMHAMGWALSVDQQYINIQKHIVEAEKYKGIPRKPERSDLLKEAIDVGWIS